MREMITTPFRCYTDHYSDALTVGLKCHLPGSSMLAAKFGDAVKGRSQKSRGQPNQSHYSH